MKTHDPVADEIATMLDGMQPDQRRTALAFVSGMLAAHCARVAQPAPKIHEQASEAVANAMDKMTEEQISRVQTFVLGLVVNPTPYPQPAPKARRTRARPAKPKLHLVR